MVYVVKIKYMNINVKNMLSVRLYWDIILFM